MPPARLTRCLVVPLLSSAVALSVAAVPATAHLGQSRPGAAEPARIPADTSPVTAPRAPHVAALVREGGALAVRTYAAASHADAEVKARQLRARAGVVAVDIDRPVRAMTDTAAAATNDAYRHLQWPLDRMRVDTAWQTSTGAAVTVAVIDSGVHPHADLAGQLLSGAEFIADPYSNPDPATTPSTGNGQTDQNGHGTHVAATIAAVAGNGAGVAGVAPGVKVLPVRVLGADGLGWSSNIAAGIIWAADNGADVINLSIGSIHESQMRSDAIAYALGKGVTVVAAAGNWAEPCEAGDTTGYCGNPVVYPAATPGVLGVGAVDSADGAASFSERGAFVDVAAAGVNVVSAYYTPAGGEQYVYMSGTSMAAPHAAAAAALLLGKNPALSPTQVGDLLTSTADDAGVSGRDDVYGHGLVDPVAALAAAPAGEPAPTPEPTPEPEPTPSPSPTPTPTPTPSPTPEPEPDESSPTIGQVHLTASRSRLVYGQRVRLTGTLFRQPDGAAGRTVRLISDPADRAPRTRTLTADADGRISITIEPGRVTRYTLEHTLPDGTVVSDAVKVKVTQRATVTRTNWPVRTLFTGRVTPRQDARVQVQVRTHRTWVVVASERAGRRGHYTLTYLRPTQPHHVRLRVRRHDGRLGWTSAPLTAPPRS